MSDPSQEGDLRNVSNVLIEHLDVQELSTIEKALAAGVSRLRSVDVLVDNAGYGQLGIFDGTPRSSVQDQFDVNVFGIMDSTRATLLHFGAKKDGIIVNVSPGAGLFGFSMISLYTASMFADDSEGKEDARLLTQISLYWFTQTIGSSVRCCWKGRTNPLGFHGLEPTSVIAAIAVFPHELPMPPR